MLKMSEWQGGSGHWYVACTDDLAHDSGAWWFPARKLGMELTDYIKMLSDYGAVMEYNSENGYLHFYWLEYFKAHSFLLMMNKKLRSIK